ncbi:hypothetical protein N7465_007355 [Penicillium sp. CMV-2018d]|nr:hypothetical protein N7465_007355 [Penicillium sp. CMV-2018d]
MKLYDLRRGTSEAVDKTVSLPLLHRFIDPRAPSKYNNLLKNKRASLLNHPKIIRLQQMRDTLAMEARVLYRSIKKAAGTKIGELKAKADTTLRVAKKKLKETTFTGTRNDSFATIDTVEINKREIGYLRAGTSYSLPLRASPTLYQELSEEDKISRRVILISALVNLSRVEKVPSGSLVLKELVQVTIASECQEPSPDDHARSEQGFSPSPEPRDRPISLTNRHCLFCIFEPNYRCYFASARKAREHLEKHLSHFKRDEFISCPDKSRGLAFRGHRAFKSHAEKVHSVRYFTEAQRIKAGL